jgi:putative aldouronate transport system permease protein
MFLSVYRVILGTFISLMVIISVAYAVSKKDLPFRRVIIWFLMGPSYIGAGIIPIYMLYRTYGLLNNFLVYILPTAFVFYYMIIIKTFFESLPTSIEESAFLDGANVVQVMIRIILPMSLPVIFTVALWSAVGHWNDWITTLMFVTKKELYPLQFLLMKVVKESELLQQLAQENAMTGGGNANVSTPTPESIKSAVFIVATIPIVTLYPFVQKYFNKGVMIGAVKE